MQKHIARVLVVLMLWNTVGFAQIDSREDNPLVSGNLSPEDPTLLDIRGTRRMIHGLDGPIDPNTYVVGPMDEYVVFLRGPRESKIPLRVLPEGTVLLPDVGAVMVAGLTIAEFRNLLEEKLASYYRNVEFDCQLVLPRSMFISILGDVARPGTYELFAPFRLDQALAMAGGATDGASLRAIELLGAEGVEQRVDYQSFLRLGDRDGNPSLSGGWAVRVPARGPVCSVIGEVGNGGSYELLPGETVADLVRLAGGLRPNAIHSRIVVERLDDDNRTQVFEITWADAASTALSPRDVVVIPDRNSFPNPDFVRVFGGGGREGMVTIQEGETIASFAPRLIRLRRDHDLARAVIERTTTSGEKEQIPVDLERVLAGEAGGDVELRAGDTINVPPYEDVVFVVGEVPAPGAIPFQRGLSAERYVVLAGGPGGNGSIDRLEIIGQDGSKRKAGRNDLVYRGETVMVKQKKWRIFQQVFVNVTSLTSLVLSIYAVSRANN